MRLRRLGNFLGYAQIKKKDRAAIGPVSINLTQLNRSIVIGPIFRCFRRLLRLLDVDLSLDVGVSIATSYKCPAEHSGNSHQNQTLHQLPRPQRGYGALRLTCPTVVPEPEAPNR